MELGNSTSETMVSTAGNVWNTAIGATENSMVDMEPILSGFRVVGKSFYAATVALDTLTTFQAFYNNDPQRFNTLGISSSDVLVGGVVIFLASNPAGWAMAPVVGTVIGTAYIVARLSGGVDRAWAWIEKRRWF